MTSTGKPLQDLFGRPVNSLRISLTQRCNFRCFFCHREGETNPNGEMTAEEVEAIVSVASDLGIRKVKLTGGEPLLRDDIIKVVSMISPLVEEVSMTTNASTLEDKAATLRRAGLGRVNISLHSARREVFREITGVDALSDVERGVKAALENGLSPVKLNMVVMNGVNSSEIPEMIEFSHRSGTVLQLIEFQPIQDGARNWDRYNYDLRTIEDILTKSAVEVRERELHRRKLYRLKGGGVVEVVRPMHNSEFCRFCTRLRVTSDGRFKPCLMRDDNLVEAVSLLRKGANGSELNQALRDAVAKREPFWRD